MTDALRLARKTTVAVCTELLAIEPLLAAIDDDLLTTLRRASAQPETRLIGVVDPDGRMVGMLPILAVAEAIVARVAPEALLAGISDVADVARFGHQVEARTVGDLMVPPATIAPDATIGEAFQIMHTRRLSGVYVVDAERRAVGYLDLLELAVRYVDALEGNADHPDASARKQVVDPPEPRAT